MLLIGFKSQSAHNPKLKKQQMHLACKGFRCRAKFDPTTFESTPIGIKESLEKSSNILFRRGKDGLWHDFYMGQSIGYSQSDQPEFQDHATYFIVNRASLKKL